MTIYNRTTGAPAEVPGFAEAVYQSIMDSMQRSDKETMQKGLEWFFKHFNKEFMILL